MAARITNDCSQMGLFHQRHECQWLRPFFGTAGYDLGCRFCQKRVPG